MPVWLASALWQYGVPILIAVLRKAGAIGWATTLAAKTVVKLENLKTYHEKQDFPAGVNGQSGTPAPDLEPGTTNTNMRLRVVPPDDQYPTGRNGSTAPN